MFGGQSCEHEISVISARNVCNALDQSKYEVQLIGISKEGQWLLPNDQQKSLAGPSVDSTEANSVIFDYSGNRELVSQNGTTTAANGSHPPDVIFPILHGPFGEDGTVQGLLELSGIPYVGSGVVGSAVGMDKAVAKMVFHAEGLKQAKYKMVRSSRWRSNFNEVIDEIRSSLEFPLFVKPANLGSSVGISKAKDTVQLRTAMDMAVTYDLKVVIEESIENSHEVEVSILGNEDPKASVVGEIIPGGEFYDYRDKYFDGKAQLLIPASIPEDVADQVRAMAVRAFQSIDANGMARVDFFVKKDTHEVFINEINTIPGFTNISMYPKMWQESGIAYTELIERLIQLALERRADKDKIQYVQ